jgi:multidrug efflux pump subunit AcrB
MPLTSFFLRNRRFSFVAFIFLLALGVHAFRTIPVSEDPALEIPRYDVVAVVPGVDPLSLENAVVRPLEDALNGLDDVKRITASIRDGVARLAVEFTFGSDTEKKYSDVLREVNAARPRLPSTLARLEVLRGQTTNVAIMQIAVVSPPGSHASLEDTAEDLRQCISGVEGVKRAEVHACPEREIQVTLNLDGMAKHKISLQQIMTSLRNAQEALPAGSVVTDGRRLDITTTGAAVDLESLRELPLAPDETGTGVVRLREVADVRRSYHEQSAIGRYNGERAVFVTAMMQKDRNIYDVSEGIRNAVTGFKARLPEGMSIEIGFDQSRNVARRMSHLERDFVFALLLVLVTLAPLGFRPAIIVMISIPLCLALGIAALQWAGFGLNQLSIVGCVLALGLLVDDSIVVVENIARFRRDGHNAAEATRLATKQIYVAVIGTTAALLFAFLPLLMLPEAAGLFVRSLPAAVVFAIVASLFVALTIVPWLASVLLARGERAHGNAVLRLLQRAITGFYLPPLRWCMRHRALALLIAAALTGGSLALIPFIGFSLFPKADTPQFLVEITAGTGTGSEATDRIAQQVEKLLQAQPEVRSMFTTIGQGNPRVYYNVFPPAPGPGIAAILVSLESYDNDHTPALIEKLRTQAAEIPGARIEFREFQNGPPVTAPVEIRITGADLTVLERAANDVEALVRDTPGTREVTNPAREKRTDVVARLNEDAIAARGIDRISALHAVRLAFAGLEAGKFRDRDGAEHTVRVVLPKEKGVSLKDGGEILIPLATGQAVPLNQIATLETSSTGALVERRNGEHAVSVRAQVQAGWNIGRVTASVRERLAKLALPAGCRRDFGGEEEGRLESFAGFGNAILLAVFGILAILVLEFKTFRGTLIVASVIPLGVIGGLLGLWIAGYSLSFMAVIGFIALIGVEIKNSILLVDFTNQLRVKGTPLDEAIAKAGEVRFLPVVLTTMTALGALAPLALERSALYSPLAVVIMGGSLSSLLLSRLVTPVLYRILPPAIATS